MPNETARARMFGLSPSEVRQGRGAERNANAMARANLPRGRGRVAAAANAGGAFGDVLGAAMGMQDPAMQQALQMEEVKREVMDLGLDFNDPAQRKDYFKAVQDGFARRGMFDHAENARQMQISEEMAERQMLVNETEAVAREKSAQASLTTAEQGGTSNYHLYVETDDDGKVIGQYNLQDGSPELQEKLAKKLSDGSPAVTRQETHSSIDKMLINNLQKDQLMLARDERGREFTANLKLLESLDTTTEKLREEIAVRGAAGRQIIDSTESLMRSIETGDRTGAYADQRSFITKAAYLAGPGIGAAFEEFFGIDPNNKDEMDRVSAGITAELTRMYSANNGRPVKALIDLMREMTPVAYSLPEGQYVAAAILNAKARADKAVQEKATAWMTPPEEVLNGPSDKKLAWLVDRRSQLQSKVLQWEREETLAKYLGSTEELQERARIATAKGRADPLPHLPFHPDNHQAARAWAAKNKIPDGRMWLAPTGNMVQWKGNKLSVVSQDKYLEYLRKRK